MLTKLMCSLVLKKKDQKSDEQVEWFDLVGCRNAEQLQSRGQGLKSAL